jgi:signal transduction histidine kinase/CheY-like chemotaxis protein
MDRSGIPASPLLVARLRIASRVCGVLVAALGALALLGWVSGRESLTGTLFNGIAMKTNTAIGLLALGVALVLCASEAPRAWQHRVGQTLALLAFAIGGATLSEHAFGWDLGIDQLLFEERPGAVATTSPNRMGLPASLCFPLFGGALLLLDHRTRGAAPSQLLGLVALLIAAVPALGYVFGEQDLYGVARFTGIAFPTAVSFLLLATGILFVRPDAGAMRLLVADTSGGVLLRRLLPTAIVFPVVLAWGRIQGQELGYYDTEFGLTLLVLSFIVVFSVSTWRTAGAVSRHSSARERAEASEAELRGELERTLASERAARAAAEQSNAAKDQFLAALSHELRTPLNAIVGWAELLAAGLPANDIPGAIATIQRNARMQAQMIGDLLDMSRIAAGKLRLDIERVDLAAVADAALAAIAPAAAAKDLVIERAIDRDAGFVSGDPARLQQVITNLLDNALKFTPRGGHVHVALRRADGRVEVVVRDTGIGIPPALIERVFDPFLQVDGSTTRRHGGLGLGLSIAAQLVGLHGGTLDAASDGAGKGACFTLRLPMEHEPAASPARDAAPDAQRLDGLRLLVVDDEPDARAVVARMLAERGADAHVASCAEDALALLSGASFDVLVSDVAMPDVDGYELLRRVRERGLDVPALAVTAFAHADDRQRALQAGYRAHVAKPVRSAELAAAVARLARLSDPRAS